MTGGSKGTFQVASKDEIGQTQAIWADPGTHECGKQGRSGTRSRLQGMAQGYRSGEVVPSNSQVTQC